MWLKTNQRRCADLWTPDLHLDRFVVEQHISKSVIWQYEQNMIIMYMEPSINFSKFFKLAGCSCSKKVKVSRKSISWQMKLHERLHLFLFGIELSIVTGCLVGIGEGNLFHDFLLSLFS